MCETMIYASIVRETLNHTQVILLILFETFYHEYINISGVISLQIYTTLSHKSDMWATLNV